MRKMLILLVLIMCISFSGCSSVSGGDPKTTEASTYLNKEYRVDPPKQQEQMLRDLYAVFQTKVLYFDFNYDAEFFIYDFETEETQKIGSVSNMLIQCRSFTCVGDTYYFYITVRDNRGNKNVLYAVDISDGEMRKVSENRYANMMISLANIDGEIYALQGDMVNGLAEPFLERIDENGRAETVEVIRDNSEVETRLMYINDDDGKLYALERNDYPGNDPADFRLFFSRYDSDFSCAYTTEITNIFNGENSENYALSGGIAEFHVFGDYFYILDYSSMGMLCKFSEEEDRVEDVFCANALELAAKVGDQDSEYFYIRRTNDIFRLDTKTGEFEQLHYDTDNETTGILVMQVCDGELFIAKRPLDSEKYKTSETWYLIPTGEPK